MDPRDRQIITQQIDKLIQRTDYGTLMDECFRRTMLSVTMMLNIEKHPDEATRHKKLFEKITKRGPTAFRTLVDICKQEFPAALDLLQTRDLPISNSTLAHKDEYQSTFNPRVRPRNTNSGRSVLREDDARNNNVATGTSGNREERKLLVEYKIPVCDLYTVKRAAERQRPKKLDVYPMENPERGVALIVNIITYVNGTHGTRNGAEKDKEKLISLFRQLGFKIFYYEDLTTADLDNLIMELKKSTHLSTECFVFYIMAHGSHTKGCDRIYLHDSSILNTEHILDLFNNANCPNLIQRPKLFFFSICRGDKPDIGVYNKMEIQTERDGLMNRNAAPNNIPTYADMLICFSTVPNHASLRDIETGSWFVESMCKIWAEHAHDTDVEHLMKLVGKDLALNRTEQDTLQTLSTEQRGFFHILYLNPPPEKHSPEEVCERQRTEE